MSVNERPQPVYCPYCAERVPMPSLQCPVCGRPIVRVFLLSLISLGAAAVGLFGIPLIFSDVPQWVRSVVGLVFAISAFWYASGREIARLRAKFSHPPSTADSLRNAGKQRMQHDFNARIAQGEDPLAGYTEDEIELFRAINPEAVASAQKKFRGSEWTDDFDIATTVAEQGRLKSAITHYQEALARCSAPAGRGLILYDMGGPVLVQNRRWFREQEVLRRRHKRV